MSITTLAEFQDSAPTVALDDECSCDDTPFPCWDCYYTGRRSLDA
jgi:hypothetical protein